MPPIAGRVGAWLRGPFQAKALFFPRLICTALFMNMEKMISEAADIGLADLNQTVEPKK